MMISPSHQAQPSALDASPMYDGDSQAIPDAGGNSEIVDFIQLLILLTNSDDSP